jgi:outer membrane biosynthesis protein TonB
MRNDHDDYYYNPYISSQRAGKGERMSGVRASFILSFAILASVGAVLFYLEATGRFEMAPARQGLYIFDKKTTATNFCDTYHCIGISPEFILPKKVDIAQIPGVQITSQIQQPTPTIASLMMPPQLQPPQPVVPEPPPSPAPPAVTFPEPSAPPSPPSPEGAETPPEPEPEAPEPEEPEPEEPESPPQPSEGLKVIEDEDMGAFINTPLESGNEE